MILTASEKNFFGVNISRSLECEVDSHSQFIHMWDDDDV